jgi:hypothetical protein
MFPTYPSHQILSDLATLKYLVRNTNYEAPDYEIFSILLLILSLRAKHFSNLCFPLW